MTINKYVYKILYVENKVDKSTMTAKESMCRYSRVTGTWYWNLFHDGTFTTLLTLLYILTEGSPLLSSPLLSSHFHCLVLTTRYPPPSVRKQ